LTIAEEDIITNRLLQPFLVC